MTARQGVFMFARKFLNQVQTHQQQLTRELIQKLSRSGKCVDLLSKVPAEEQEESIGHIYREMSRWLIDEDKSVDEEYYINLGVRRGQQGVPFSDLLFGVSAARQYFWEYVERETLLDTPTDFWGGVTLLHLLDSCLDSALYFAAIGHQKAVKQSSSSVSAMVHR
jgi:hypothetical protein